MTKKDYIRIAECIKKHRNGNIRLMVEFCKVFKTDNPRFDKDRFLKACGMELDGE